MTRPTCIVIFCSLLLLAAPSVSNAFVIHDRAAVQLTETTALYSITYSSRTTNRDVYFPTTANPSADTDNDVEYEITTDPGASVAVASMVLSDAKVVNGRYFIPQNDDTEMTLYVLLQTSAEVITNTMIGLKSIEAISYNSAEDAYREFNLRGAVVEASVTPTPTPQATFTP